MEEEYSRPGDDVTAPLELVTFEELVARIADFKERAQTQDSRAAWAKLLDVASDMAGSANTEDDITAGRTWYLTQVRISGYQGIGDGQPLEIAFEPTPGITVVHGPNGSGKSSIADAVETALQGRIRPPALEGRGGNAPIWEREHRGRDADNAVVVLTLLAGSEALEIHCALGNADQTTRYVATHRTSSSEREIDLSSTRWMSAVVGHRPVYAYAAVERQVQVAKNLQQFLESLLAFGSCFETLSAEVVQRSEEATDAKQRWDNALKAAQERIRAVDDERSATGRASLDPLTWPSVEEKPDEWLERQGLTEVRDALPEVTDQDLNSLRGKASMVDEQLEILEAAETSLHARLAGPLKDLHTEATEIEEPGIVCPVCGTEGVLWVDHLGDSIEGLVEFRSIQRSYRTAISALGEAAKQGLGDVRTIVLARDGDGANLAWWTATVKPFLDAEHSAGDRVTTDLRSAGVGLTSWVNSSDCERLLRDAAAESDFLRQWNRARAAAVAEFVSIWRSVAANARESSTWESANSRLRDLRNALREERAEVLGTQTNAKVQALLADVGITLKSITVQGRQASLEVVDQQDKPVRLAMLSAGQRNALLLAPMLAVSGGGPFGCLILDDPVHAFDQIRVDRLAAAIADLASTRRVIVLTHDERLKEHLLARHPNCAVLSLERDPLTGLVSAVAQGEMWQALLEDALHVVDAVRTQPGGVALPPHDIVRGLCRQALDNALRSFLLRAAVQNGRSPETDLAVLDDQDTTKERITAARGLLSSGSLEVAVLDEAASRVNAYLAGWNRAAHGNKPTDEPDFALLRTEIQAAEQGCQVLMGVSP